MGSGCSTSLMEDTELAPLIPGSDFPPARQADHTAIEWPFLADRKLVDASSGSLRSLLAE